MYISRQSRTPKAVVAPRADRAGRWSGLREKDASAAADLGARPRIRRMISPYGNSYYSDRITDIVVSMQSAIALTRRREIDQMRAASAICHHPSTR